MNNNFSDRALDAVIVIFAFIILGVMLNIGISLFVSALRA